MLTDRLSHPLVDRRMRRYLASLAVSFGMAAGIATVALPMTGCSGGDAPAVTAESTPGASEAEAQADAKAEAIAKLAAEGKTVVTPEQLVSAADQLIKKGRHKDANTVLSLALKANPKLAEAYVLRASIFANADLRQRAIADMTRAIALKPDQAAYLNARGYYSLSDQSYAQALADFDAAIAADPGHPAAHNNRGLVNMAVRRYEESIGDFDAAIAAKPDYVQALNNRGFAKLQLERFDASLADFDAAVAADPKFANAWSNRGMARLRVNRTADAVADFTQAIELAPSDPSYYERRAEAYRKADQGDLAQADLAQVKWLRRLGQLTVAIRRNPQKISSYIARSRHLAASGRTAQAIADLDRALEVNPAATEAMIEKAQVLADTDQADAARQLCDAVLQIEPLPEAYSLRGDILYQSGQLDAAIADYEAAQRMDSQVARAFFERSEKRKTTGQIQQASADYQTAIQLDPSLRR